MIITERPAPAVRFPNSPCPALCRPCIGTPPSFETRSGCAVALLRMRSLVDGIKEAPHPEERSPFDKMAGASRRTHRAVPPGWPSGLAAEGENRCACSQRCRRKVCAWCRRRRAPPRRSAMTASSRWRTSTTRSSRSRSPARRPSASNCTPASRSPSRAPRWRWRRSAGIWPARPAVALSSAWGRRCAAITSDAFRCRGRRRRRACANTSRSCARSGIAGNRARSPPMRGSIINSH